MDHKQELQYQQDGEDLDSILQLLARQETLNQLSTNFLTTDHAYQSSAPFFAANFPANSTQKPLDFNACTASPTKESWQDEVFWEYSSLGLYELLIPHVQRDLEDLIFTPALPLPPTHMPKPSEGDDPAGMFRSKSPITSAHLPAKYSAVVSCATNSSLSSSLTEEAHLEAEECSIRVAGGTDSKNSTTVRSKRKAPAMAAAASQNYISVTTHQENQTKTAPTKRIINKRVGGKRFAIQTRSAKDILDDGYRWRKYGQKPVKNSSHPRSYYRCTWFNCSVKKMVERSAQDPGIVITTYQGVHLHPTPAGAVRNYSINTQISRPKHLPIDKLPSCSSFDLAAQAKALVEGEHE